MKDWFPESFSLYCAGERHGLDPSSSFQRNPTNAGSVQSAAMPASQLLARDCEFRKQSSRFQLPATNLHRRRHLRLSAQQSSDLEGSHCARLQCPRCEAPGPADRGQPSAPGLHLGAPRRQRNGAGAAGMS
jgi:hypothetical protein